MTADLARKALELAHEIVRVADGFRGTFAFDPAHTEDHGIGHIGEFHDFPDRLRYVPSDCDVHDDEAYTIADDIEPHVAEPIAQMLNAAPVLATAMLRAEAVIAAAREWHKAPCAKYPGCADVDQPGDDVQCPHDSTELALHTAVRALDVSEEP